MRATWTWASRTALFGLLAVPTTVVAADGDDVATRAQAANKVVEDLKVFLASSEERMQTAETDQDFVQINCINNRMGRLRGLVKLANTAKKDLDAALASNDTTMINHALSKIDLAQSKGENLHTEVEGCVGEASKYTGPTEVQRSVDDSVRADDPSEGGASNLEPIPDTRPTSSSGSE